jgi:hypothetical protein
VVIYKFCKNILKIIYNSLKSEEPIPPETI